MTAIPYLFIGVAVSTGAGTGVAADNRGGCPTGCKPQPDLYEGKQPTGKVGCF